MKLRLDPDSTSFSSIRIVNNDNQIAVAFGSGTLFIEADPDLAEWDVIRPQFEEALTDVKERFVEAVRNPIGSKPLRELIEPSDRVLIATSDGTRPVPNRQLIPWLLEELPVPEEQVTVMIGTGTHRANTREEIAGMFGEDLVKRIRILNHDAFDESRNVLVGKIGSGTPVYLNEAYLEADKRIAVGFIEPHFFAGFSGGPKAVAPGLAGIETILRLHRSELIGDPNSTWGVLEENPLHREIREAVALSPPEFMVNVTLNSEKAITAFYSGDYGEAHRKGCADVKVSAMVAVDEPYPVVVTSNSGFPLDQNLYQTVKGISAAARIVDDQGAILVASECSDGVPDHGNFASLMRTGDSPRDVLQEVYDREPILDQWQAQILAGILNRTNVTVYSRMDCCEIEACKLSVTDDLEEALRERIESVGSGARVAVLPDGPLTIPYIREE